MSVSGRLAERSQVACACKPASLVNKATDGDAFCEVVVMWSFAEHSRKNLRLAHVCHTRARGRGGPAPMRVTLYGSALLRASRESSGPLLWFWAESDGTTPYSHSVRL